MYAARVRRLVHRQALRITLHIQIITTPKSIWWKISLRSKISKLFVETGQVQLQVQCEVSWFARRLG